MGTLAECLEKVGLTGAKAKFVTDAANRYKSEGFEAQDAHRRAVRGILRDTRKQHRSVLQQVHDALDDDVRGQVFPVDKPQVAQGPAQPAPAKAPARTEESAATPEPAAGMVRMYHGGNGEGKRAWLTADQKYAEGYATKDGRTDGRVSYVDIPADSPLLQPSYNDEGLDQKAPPVSFEADENLTSQLKPYQPTAAPGRAPSASPPAEVAAPGPAGSTWQDLRAKIASSGTTTEEGEAVVQLHEAAAASFGLTPDEYAAEFDDVRKTTLGESEILSNKEVTDKALQGYPLHQKDSQGPIINGAHLYKQGKSLIEVFEGSQKLSTLVHESFHAWDRMMAKYRPDDHAVAASWAGAKKGTDGKWVWDVASREKFARGGERYLRTGKAPTPALKKVFEQFKKWLGSVYGAIRGSAIDIKISPEMLKAYDNIFAGVAPVREQNAQQDKLAAQNTGAKTVNAPDREQGRGPLAAKMAERREKAQKQAAPKQKPAPKDMKFAEAGIDVGQAAAKAKPATGEAPKSVDPEVEKRWQSGKYRQTVRSRLGKMIDTVASVTNSFRRKHKLLDPKVFGATLDIMRRADEIPAWAKAHAFNALRGITAGLNKDTYDTFTRVVILRDLKKDVDNGMYDPYTDAEGNEIRKELPFGYTPETLEQDLDRFEEAAKDPAIKAALERRQKFMHTLRDDLVERKLLPAKVTEVEDYFHHQVLMHMADKRGDGLGMRRFGPQKKGWQKARTGSSQDYNTDYLDAEYAVISQAIQQLKVQEALARLRELNDIVPALKAIYEKDWRKHIPDGYKAWQPTKGNFYYSAMTLPEKALEQYLAGEKVLTRADFDELLAVGARKEEWYIPAELHDTLETFRPQKESDLGRAVATSVGALKKWMLTAPHRAPKYNLNNMSGDIDATLGYEPGIFMHFANQARKDVTAYHTGKTPLTAEYSRGIELGVLGSGRSSEINRDTPHLSSHRAFKGISSESEGLASRIWHFGERFTAAREDVMRLAAWRYFKKKLDANTEGRLYGTSPRAEIDQMWDAKEPKDVIAARMARDLLGDYGNVSDAGVWLRSHAVPFYSWWEINLPRYVRMIKNAGHEGSSKGAVTGLVVKGATKTVGRRMAQMAIFYAGVNLWNHLMFGDLEKELSDEDQRELHLILGRRPDGSVRTVRIEGAFADWMSWFDLQDLPSDVGEYMSGEATLKDKGIEALKAPVNKAVGGMMPVAKSGLEAATGWSVYPDLWNPRVIRDRKEHLAKLLIPVSTYRWMVGKPHRNNTAGEMLGELLSYSNDPGEAAYYGIRHKAAKFKEKISGDEGDYTPGDQANALYYWKQSQKYGDEVLAEKWLNQYFALGGTKEGIHKSVLKTHPIGFLTAEQKADFVMGLGKDEVQVLNRAVKWYERTYGTDAASEPRVQKGEPPRKYTKDAILGPVEEAATRYVRMAVLSGGRPKAATVAMTIEEREAEYVKERDAAEKWLKDHKDHEAVRATIDAWLGSEKYAEALEDPTKPKRRSRTTGRLLKQADKTTINDEEWAAMQAYYQRQLERQQRAKKLGDELR